MKILQYGMNGYFTYELKKRGHDVFLVSFNPDADMFITEMTSMKDILVCCKQRGFIPDVFFYGDDGGLPLVWGIEALPFPSVFYSIDTYCHAWHDMFARGFDYILFAQKNFEFSFSGESEYFPLYASFFSEPETFEEWKQHRDIPVSFVGGFGQKNNSDRHRFFSCCKTKMPIVAVSGDFRKIYARSRIVLNQSAVGEINFRTFEAMGLGCACLSDTDLTQTGGVYLFNIMENSLPLYPRHDAEAAVSLCRYWLGSENEKKLYEIAMKGREEVLQKHSIWARAERLENIFRMLLQKKSLLPRLTDKTAAGQGMADAYAYMAEHTVIDSEYKEQYRKTAALMRAADL